MPSKSILQRPLLLFGAIFIGYLLLNLEHITDPPYWDAVSGYFIRGLWLRDHGLDYAAMFTQLGYYHGGPGGTLCFAGPMLTGLLLTYVSPTMTIILLHLAIYLCTSAVLVIFFNIIRSYCSTQLALLWILSAAVNPVWTGQSASLYLEIPLGFCICISLYYFWKEQYGLAALACVIGFFIKSSALLLALVYFIWFCGLGIHAYFFKNKRHELIQKAPLLLSLPVLLVLNLGDLAPETYSLNHPGYLLYSFVVNIAFLLPIMGVIAILALITLPFGKKMNKQFNFSNPTGRLIYLMLLLIAGFWSSYCVYSLPLPRYSLLILFPMTCLLAFNLAGKHNVSMGIAGLLIAIGLMNQNGRWFPRLPDIIGRSGCALERSREYLIDLSAHQRICSLLETTMSQYPILTKWPLTHMLTHPEMGYVHKPLPHVIEAGIDSTLNPATFWIPWLKTAKYKKSICVYVPHNYEFFHGISLIPLPGDVILYEDKSLPTPITVYIRLWKGRAIPRRSTS